MFILFGFKINISQILVVEKRFHIQKFKEAYTHKERKKKEDMEGVHERIFQNSSLMIMLMHLFKNEKLIANS